jgi:hypothetical protein
MEGSLPIQCHILFAIADFCFMLIARTLLGIENA